MCSDSERTEPTFSGGGGGEVNFKMKIGLLSVSTFFCFAPPVFITNKLMYWVQLVDQAFHDNALYMFYCTFTKGEPFPANNKRVL